jgi:PTH1 family peptidyl-tRNA hydrolase
MNNSGEAVVALAKFYKIPLKNIWVVHDDLDLALGRIKIQSDRSAAGHNGVKSIIAKLGSQKFLRFRIGIQPLSLTQKPSEKLVLEKFPLAEKALLNQGLEKTVAAIFECLQNGLEKTMTKFNA